MEARGREVLGSNAKIICTHLSRARAGEERTGCGGSFALARQALGQAHHLHRLAAVAAMRTGRGGCQMFPVGGLQSHRRQMQRLGFGGMARISIAEDPKQREAGSRRRFYAAALRMSRVSQNGLPPPTFHRVAKARPGTGFPPDAASRCISAGK